jgi:hypothetical protein
MVYGVVGTSEIEERWFTDMQLLHEPEVGMKVRTAIFVLFFCYYAAYDLAEEL